MSSTTEYPRNQRHYFDIPHDQDGNPWMIVNGERAPFVWMDVVVESPDKVRLIQWGAVIDKSHCQPDWVRPMIEPQMEKVCTK